MHFSILSKLRCCVKVAFLLILTSPLIRAQVSPINNSFNNAKVISGINGAETGNNTGASKEPGEPEHAGNPGGKSIWYRWVAPESNKVTFTTQESDFDTLLGIYLGSEVSSLTLISSNDDISVEVPASRVSFNAIAGRSYLIAIDGVGGRSGTIKLSWKVGVSISGFVLIGNSGPIPPPIGGGGRIVLSGDASRTIGPPLSVFYIFDNLQAGGNYAVEFFDSAGRSLHKHTFSPLLDDAENVNFTGLGGTTVSTSSLSGKVRDARGKGLEGVNFILVGPRREVSSMTDKNGGFGFSFLDNGSYIVTPSSSHRTFSPMERRVSIVGVDILGADFVATDSQILSGQVKGDNGNPIGGITITLTGTKSLVTVTDQTGYYFLSVPSGGSYTIAPSSAGYLFTRPRETLTNLLENHKDINFIGVPAFNAASASAASYGTKALAAESIAALFGTNFTTSLQSASTLPLPTTLKDVTISITDSKGAERLAPLFFVSPTQINYQIPSGAATGMATLKVLDKTIPVATGKAEIAQIAPGLFSAEGSGQGLAAAQILRVKPDGMQSYEPTVRFDASQNRFVAIPIDLGSPGEQVFLILYGTGFRFRKSLAATDLRLGGENTQVLYAGPTPGFEGLDQINVLIPRNLSGRGEVEVKLTVEGEIANLLKISIK